MKYVPPQFDTESEPFSYSDKVKKAKRRMGLIMKSSEQTKEHCFAPNEARDCIHPWMLEDYKE